MAGGRPWQLGLYEKSMPEHLSLPDKLAAARDAGYDYLELSIDETDEKLARLDWAPEQSRELRRAMEDTGLPVKSICLSGHRRFPLGDDACSGRSLEIMERCVALAVALGVRIIQLAGYDVYDKQSTERTRALFAKNLAACVDMAAREGVILAFETMETDFLNTVEKAAYWVDTIGSPFLEIYPDVGNITNAALSGGDPCRDLESGSGHIVAVHLKESRPGVFREVPYGEGHVDFERVAGKSLQLGVRLFVGEFWHAGEADYGDTLRRNYRFLSGILQRAAQNTICTVHQS